MAGTSMSDSKALLSDASSPVSLKKSAEHGAVCRCRQCRLSIHVIAVELPMVCPFCHRRLARERYHPPLSTPEPEGS